MATLGIRNKNPFNLRSNHVNWLGKIGSYNGFVVFANLDVGIRAGLINLATQLRRSTSLYNFVCRYAPPSENDTRSYYNFLYRRLGINWYDIVHDNNYFHVLAYCITVYEGNTIDLSKIREIDEYYHIFNKHLALLKKHG